MSVSSDLGSELTSFLPWHKPQFYQLTNREEVEEGS
jgi:hypothetical protein